MDKWMDNPWFIKILSLVLALLLYSSVSYTSNSKLTDVYVPSEQTTETITNIPVKAYYDTENLVVTGIPNTVDMTIKGPIIHVQTAKALRNFEVYVDLTNAKVGKQKVKLKVRNLSDRLIATIKPATINVTVQEKITKDFKVDAEFNSNEIGDGYAAGQPIVEPRRVKITGAKSEIDSIAYVKAVVEDNKPLKDTLSREARVQVLDKDLNKLSVTVEPSTVKVTIPIKATSKTVPINIVQKGTPPSGISIASISLDAKEAVISGSEDILKNTDSVRVEVDVSKITDNTTLNLPVIIANGITKVTPQMAKVTVVVNKQGQKTISEVPIKMKGLAPNNTVQMDDPVSQSVDIIINGPSAALTALGPDDFSAYIDVSNLEAGSHDVDIQIDGPSGINWKTDRLTAKITIKNNA
ncbi:YbbR-like domain-containing protein [Bacillus sp. BRMEA1]|uniref:CdaR family protein n=1 Tax=Neobacillus endophyticus TaxID=2738405 RepID=UPI0015655706|nr:CdaR family protein [Neobacillus endophyticus]NRD77579.1 YbbR-like domain-containing protein [Neobacillus endophyticus]